MQTDDWKQRMIKFLAEREQRAALRAGVKAELNDYIESYQRRLETPGGIELVDFMQLELAQQREQVREAEEIIESYIDDEECSLDHHGYCQTHNWMSADKCINKRAKKWLESLK